jgi:two-component system phosphate regulon response regulator PhoB
LGEQSLLPSLDQQYYRDEHLFVHLRHRVVMLDGQAITLTRMQHRLLALLVQHAGEVVTRPILVMQIRGYGPKMGPRRAAAHIHGLRRRLGVYADHIETIIGIGYRFRPFLPRN